MLLEGRVEFRQYIEDGKVWIAFTQRLPSVNKNRPWLVWQNFYAVEASE